MRPEIIDLSQARAVDGGESAAVRRVVEGLRGGELIVFPTETVYGLGVLASNEAAVSRLIAEKGRRAGHALPIAIAGPDVLRRYAPNAGKLAERLARRCQPGPLTLVLDGTDPKSELRRLPEKSIKAIMPETTVGFRVPNAPFFLRVLREVDEPVVLTSANLTGEPPATSALEAKAGLDERPDLIVDDGPARFGKPSTVARIVGDETTILREGAISAERLRRLSAKLILFVCAGNTCRSPMAEVLAQKRIAEKLGCDVPDLPARGYVVESAGVAAGAFEPASENARTVVREDFGLNLDEHASRQLDAATVRAADLILTASRSHLRALVAAFPEAASRADVLRPDGGDVADPFGGPVSVYRSCARQIDEAIRARLPELVD